MGESIAEVAARAARSLTPSMKKALLTTGHNPADDVAYAKPGVARQMHDMGLTHVEWSPLGIAVRNHLISQGADHDR